jgi:glyoxylase-like metal-dependent hydrolase (beta-lactamase superfamily II)
MATTGNSLGIHQLRDPATSTCSYLVWDPESRAAAMIDPVLEHSHRDIELVFAMGLRLTYTVETHVHTDHVTGSHALREAFSSILIVHENSRAKCADVLVRDGDFIPLGTHRLNILYTPGHSGGDICLSIPGAVFTGDTLLIRSCGRTDYPSGNSGELYDSITRRLFTLPEETVVWPGHDYLGQGCSTIGAEKKYNPGIGNGVGREEFIRLMGSFRPGQPARLYEAFPSNLRCGTQCSGT